LNRPWSWETWTKENVSRKYENTKQKKSGSLHFGISGRFDFIIQLSKILLRSYLNR